MNIQTILHIDMCFKVEQDTSQSMQTLLRLDEVKGRMMDASAALQEADNWTTLSADVDDVFDSGDVAKVRRRRSSGGFFNVEAEMCVNESLSAAHLFLCFCLVDVAKVRW